MSENVIELAVGTGFSRGRFTEADDVDCGAVLSSISSRSIELAIFTAEDWIWNPADSEGCQEFCMESGGALLLKAKSTNNSCLCEVHPVVEGVDQIPSPKSSLSGVANRPASARKA